MANNTADVSGLWDIFKTKIHQLRDKYVPILLPEKPFWKRKASVPLSLEVRNMIRKKSRLHTAWIRSQNEDNCRAACEGAKLSIIHSDKENANIQQKQFSSVFTIEPEGQLPRFDTRTRSSIPEVNIPAEMVSKKIKALDKNNACGLNGINPAYCESLLTMFRSRSQKYSINPLRIRCFLRTGKQW